MASANKEYAVGQAVYALPGIEAFSAFETRTGSPALLWRFRRPAPLETEFGREFDAFCSLVRVHRVGFLRFEQYGFSGDGYPYWITEAIPLAPLSGQMLTAPQIHYYFIKMVSYLTAVHRNGFGCGNLCAESFVVHEGRLRFVGIIPEIGGCRDDALANAEYAAFLSPEQRMGQTATPASDIYALGVYLFRLVTRRTFRAEPNEALHLSTLRSSMQLHVGPRAGTNTWVMELLPKLLAWKPEERISNADELLAFVPRLSARIRLEDAIFDLRLRTGGMSSAADMARSGASTLSPLAWATIVTVVLVIIVMAAPVANFLSQVSENYEQFKLSDAGKAAEKDIQLSLNADLDRSKAVLNKAVAEAGKATDPSLSVATKLNQTKDELHKNLAETNGTSAASSATLSLPGIDLERAKRVLRESVEAGANYKEPAKTNPAPQLTPWTNRVTNTTQTTLPSAQAKAATGQAAPPVVPQSVQQQAAVQPVKTSAVPLGIVRQQPVAAGVSNARPSSEDAGAGTAPPQRRIYSKAFIEWVLGRVRLPGTDWCQQR